jgi:hypothetical protein
MYKFYTFIALTPKTKVHIIFVRSEIEIFFDLVKFLGRKITQNCTLLDPWGRIWVEGLDQVVNIIDELHF